MSKQELRELIAPLSDEQRNELRELLDEAPRQLTDEELENDPMMKVIREIDRMPPMDVPPDFSANYRNYRESGEKSES